VKGATNHLTPGQRVAYYRRRRGMSQQVLADLVGKTLSWVEKIESGRANLQVLPNIARIAEVLDIAPWELLPDDIVNVDNLSRGRSVPALRQRLMSYRFVNPRYLAEDAQPVPVGQLEVSVAGVWSASGVSVRICDRRAAPATSGCDRHCARRRRHIATRRVAARVLVPSRLLRAHQGR
jgi:transcriptional regulator with XRE-family HTH domain